MLQVDLIMFLELMYDVLLLMLYRAGTREY